MEPWMLSSCYCPFTLIHVSVLTRPTLWDSYRYTHFAQEDTGLESGVHIRAQDQTSLSLRPELPQFGIEDGILGAAPGPCTCRDPHFPPLRPHPLSAPSHQVISFYPLLLFTSVTQDPWTPGPFCLKSENFYFFFSFNWHQQGGKKEAGDTLACRIKDFSKSKASRSGH